MVSYNVIIAPRAKEQLESYIDYVHYTLLNEISAKNVYSDAEETIARLANIAGSLSFCQHPKLKEHGYRAIRFKRHEYVMLYRVAGQTAYVDAVYHQKQDYENTFASKL